MRYILLLLISLAIATVKPVFAHDQHDNKEKVLYVFTHPEYIPFNYIDESGQLTGIAVDLINEMLEPANFKYTRPVPVPWARGYYLVKNQANTIMFSLFKTSERHEQLNLIGPFATSDIVIIAKKDKPINNTQPHLVGLRNSATKSAAVENGFNNVSDLNKYYLGLDMLNAERADGWVVSLSVAKSLIKKNNFNFDDYYIYKTLSTKGLYFGLSKNSDPEIIEFLNNRFNNLRDSGKLQQITEKYQELF